MPARALAFAFRACTTSGSAAASCLEHCRVDSCQWVSGFVLRALSLLLRAGVRLRAQSTVVLLFVACSTSSRRDPFSGFDADRRRWVVYATAKLCEVERVELARRLRPIPFVTQSLGGRGPH